MAKRKPSDGVLQGLNKQQRRAVRHGDDPLLVIAGAGTGKTKTLVHRVARLIERGKDPSRILLLTFTRRAAGEMLRRVDTLLRKGDHRIHGSTSWIQILWALSASTLSRYDLPLHNRRSHGKSFRRRFLRRSEILSDRQMRRLLEGRGQFVRFIEAVTV